MKLSVKLLSLLFIAGVISSCSSSSNDVTVEPDRVRVVESFDGNDVVLAGPTAYGDNLYEGYVAEDENYPRFTTNTSNKYLEYGILQDSGNNYNVWNGCLVASNWSSTEGTTKFKEQFMVYLPNLKEGGNIGHSGENFAVIYVPSSIGASTPLSFKKGAKVNSMWVNNTAYTAGVAINGNEPAKSLVESKGYYKVTVKGYVDVQGNAVAEDEMYLVDYRGDSEVLISEWTKFELKNISKFNNITALKFFVEGSDVAEYDNEKFLSTPTYLAIDDIEFEVAE